MDALTKRYQQELKHTRETVRNHVERTWRSLPDYRSHNQREFLDKVLPVVQAGQERAVSLTSAYMSERLGLSGPLGLPMDLLTGAGVRNGILPAMVYERPFTTLYSSIEKLGFAQAFEKALSRLTETADMDVAMAARDASMAAGQMTNTQVFQRVAAPDCCAFCAEVDGALVKVEDPAPLHNNCSCTVEPYTGEVPEDAKFLSPNSTIGDTRIEEHGEMGPYIYNAESHWTPVADSEKWADYREAADRYKAANEEAYNTWLDSLPQEQKAFYTR